MKTVKVEVIGERAVHHSGVDHIPGDRFEMEEDGAYTLAEKGMVKLLPGGVDANRAPSVVNTLNDPTLADRRAEYEAMGRNGLFDELKRRGLPVSRNTPSKFLVLKLLQNDKGIK